MLNALSFDVDELETTMRESVGLPPVESPLFLVENTHHTLDLLREAGTKATFFVNGRSVAPHPGLVARIAEEGHEIGAHSYAHRFVSDYGSVDEFREDLQRCIEIIDRETGRRPIGYRAPGNTLFRNRGPVLEVLAELGFRYDSSLPAVASRAQHGYTRGPERPFVWENGIVEFPMPCVHRFGLRWPVMGAHVLRLLPYALTAWSLRALNRSGAPGFLYAHSFELFDQPVTRDCLWFSLGQRVYLARRGAQMQRKLHQLLSDFEFGPYRDFLDGVSGELPELAFA